MKALKALFAMSLFTFVISALFVRCDSDTLVPAQKPAEIAPRSCNTISQQYVNRVKELAASELSIPVGYLNVGLAEKTSSSSGLWHDPTEVVGKVIDDDFEGFLFVVYDEDPLTDAIVVGYYYDTSFCVMPSSQKVIDDDFEGVLAATLNIVTDDFEGF